MEAAAAVVSFVGLAGPVAQGLKFLYDFTTDMKDCPKDIREMKTDLELVEELITQVIRQCNERDVRLRESAALARAIRHAQESVEDLKKELTAYVVDGKRKRIRFAGKVSQTQKLRASLDRTKTIMFELKNQLQSDLLYDIRDTNEKVLQSVEKTNRDLETHDRSFHKAAQQSAMQAKSANDSLDRVENSVQQTNDNSTEGLIDIKIVAKKLEHITSLLTETRITSPQSSAPSTPALSRGLSELSAISSSQETTVSSITSFPSVQSTTNKVAGQVDITSGHPLLRFKDNQFHFVIAVFFTQRTNKQKLACQRAFECLTAYSTPAALSRASPENLSKFFGGIGLQNERPPKLIGLAQAYAKDPPRPGKVRSKKGSCPDSEITHLPWIGKQSVDTWWVYWCNRTDVVTENKTLVEYMEHIKKDAGGSRCGPVS